MKKIITTLFVLLLYSCDLKEDKKIKIVYSYNNLDITRIDEGNEIFLYLNDIKKNNYVLSTIKGRDGLLQAYIRFNTNATVDIIRKDGFIEDKNEKDSLNVLDLHFSKFRKFEKSIEGKYNNVYFISDYLDLEKRMNKKNESNVLATGYGTDGNSTD